MIPSYSAPFPVIVKKGKGYKVQIKVSKSNCSMILEYDGITPIPMQDLLCALEKETIGTLLTRHKGVKIRVAETLMLNRTTLVEKAKKYGFPLKK